MRREQHNQADVPALVDVRYQYDVFDGYIGRNDIDLLEDSDRGSDCALGVDGCGESFWPQSRLWHHINRHAAGRHRVVDDSAHYHYATDGSQLL
jgi:hypothetical protein